MSDETQKPAESKADLKALCRGNRTDRGWKPTAEGRWVPSVHDRRRVAGAEIGALAQAQGGFVAGAQVQDVLERNSTGHVDYTALADNFVAWTRGQGK